MTWPPRPAPSYGLWHWRVPAVLPAVPAAGWWDPARAPASPIIYITPSNPTLPAALSPPARVRLALPPKTTALSWAMPGHWASPWPAVQGPGRPARWAPLLRSTPSGTPPRRISADRQSPPPPASPFPPNPRPPSGPSPCQAPEAGSVPAPWVSWVHWPSPRPPMSSTMRWKPLSRTTAPTAERSRPAAAISPCRPGITPISWPMPVPLPLPVWAVWAAVRWRVPSVLPSASTPSAMKPGPTSAGPMWRLPVPLSWRPSPKPPSGPSPWRVRAAVRADLSVSPFPGPGPSPITRSATSSKPASMAAALLRPRPGTSA